ncbi:hypothetical protein F5Y09DRAFT_357652 [Xylaria sp. FL1042]|nr:hypothetical protein F5Y09DRAFT_357652 [Xylaria sp. FL1042]
MSSTPFQKYLEDMNREPLDKKPGHQCPNILLPHERTGPAQEPEPRSPDLSKEQVGQSTYQQDNTEALSKTPMNNGGRYDKYSTPKHNGQLNGHQNNMSPLDHQSKPSEFQLPINLHQGHNYAFSQQGRQYESPMKNSITDMSPRICSGLAKSRWADSSYNSAPAGKPGQLLNNYSTPLPSQKEPAVAKPTVTPASKSTSYWQPGGKDTSTIQDKPAAPKCGSNPFDEQKSTYLSNPNESDRTQSNGWDTLEDARHQNGESDLQPSTLQASAPTARENTEATNKSTIAFDYNIPDPRVNWPTESCALSELDHKIVRQNKDLGSESWKKSSEEMSCSTEVAEAVPQHVTEFIEHWRQSAHSVEAGVFSQLGDLHEDCDIDTYKGVLLQPVEYPKTKPQELMSRSQLESTSALLVRQFAAEVARRDPNRKAQKKAEKKARAAARAAAAGETANPVTSFEEPPNPNEVQIPCHLRPAVESDMEAIAAIYNQEIVEGYKVMDTKPVKQADFQGIYKQSLAEKMPFIVAVEGWYNSMDTADQEVIGFALVTPVRRGIAGSYETLSRCGGKLLVIVKPECRRKRIGTALMDIIITNCTGWHMPKGGYQFVNFTHDWISKEFGSSSRIWWYLEMEVMVLSAENEKRTREGKEFQWIWNFLESKFNLFLKHYDEKCFYRPHGGYWLDKLTFRRDCCTR